MKSIDHFLAFNDVKKDNTLLTWKEFKNRLKGKKLILVGAGNVCEEFIKKYGDKYNIYIIADSDIKKVGKKLRGISIIGLEEVKNISDDFLLLITSTKYNEELKNSLGHLYKDRVFSLLDMEVLRIHYHSLKRFHSLKYKLLASDSITKNVILFTLSAILRTIHFPGFYEGNERKIERLKNIANGNRCFIIAPGPSLRKSDVEKLKDEITFSVNGAFKAYLDTDFKPNYYVLLDSCTIPQYRFEDDTFRLDKCASDKIFLADCLKDEVMEKGNTDIVYISASAWDSVIRKIHSFKLKYSYNLVWGHYSAYTVTNFAINIAEYMGFKEIYLLGVDCNYGSGRHYFDNSKNVNVIDEKTAGIMQNEQMEGYKFIKEVTEKRGVKIYNATRGGALEVFERVDFDSLF